MANILKKYTKTGIVTIGDDNRELDTPIFEIVNIDINTVSKKLRVDVLHEVTQGTLTNKHQRSYEMDFNSLPASVKTTGKAFLDAIETELLKLPQYTGATEV